MEKELNEIRDFVESLEVNELDAEQQAILLVGEGSVYGKGDNEYCSESVNSSYCNNTKDCGKTQNAAGCTNGPCASANNSSTCTGGGGTGGSSGGGSGAAGYGTLGFPGFGF